jgi:hypothetical protein
MVYIIIQFSNTPSNQGKQILEVGNCRRIKGLQSVRRVVHCVVIKATTASTVPGWGLSDVQPVWFLVVNMTNDSSCSCHATCSSQTEPHTP